MTDSNPKSLAHVVYFTLKDRSTFARDTLIEACNNYLSGHPGTLYFAAGSRAEAYQRDVNDTRHDVALLLVFETEADHDRYQDSERHQQFIRENSANWAEVRVFDSFV